MKRAIDIGLEVIELEDQVLLVNNDTYYASWILSDDNIYENKSSVAIKGVDYKKAKKIISSTKQIDGLPLLVIEDEIEIAYYEDHDSEVYGEYEMPVYRAGYQAHQKTHSFSEEDMKKAFLAGLVLGEKEPGGNKTSEFEYLIQSLIKKELWIEVEYQTSESGLRATDLPMIYKITSNQIKAIWK